MMALVMAVIACSSILLAKEYISANVYKSAKKLIIINLVAIVGFAVLYPKILDFEYTSILIKLVVMWYVLPSLFIHYNFIGEDFPLNL